jgi:hypothetical protein
VLKTTGMPVSKAKKKEEPPAFGAANNRIAND